jgi:hypothetical protein
MLESTGRLQKCRIYEMSDNRTLRATVSCLIARDAAHEAAFAKALETLGVDWGKTLPIPKFDATKYPEVKELMDRGVHRKQHHWRLDGSGMGKIFRGTSPLTDTDAETTLEADEDPPEGGPDPRGRRATGGVLARAHPRAHGAGPSRREDVASTGTGRTSCFAGLAAARGTLTPSFLPIIMKPTQPGLHEPTHTAARHDSPACPLNPGKTT